MICLLAALLSSVSLHTLWFFSDLPVHLTKLARCLGFRQDSPDFWPQDLDYKFWYRTRWEAWLESRKDLPLWLQTGLVCPACMSFHCSWVGALLAGICFQGGLITTIGAALCGPGVVLMSHFALKTLMKHSRAQSDDKPAAEKKA